MKTMTSFEPMWATPPGATVLDVLQERGWDVGHLAKEAHRDLHEVSRLLYGVAQLDAGWAESLSRVLGSTTAFWLRREEQYRSDLRRLSTSAEVSHAWLGALPVRDMIKFGWIESGHSAEETLINACAFLGVSTSKAFESKYERLIGASATVKAARLKQIQQQWLHGCGKVKSKQLPSTASPGMRIAFALR